MLRYAVKTTVPLILALAAVLTAQAEQPSVPPPITPPAGEAAPDADAISAVKAAREAELEAIVDDIARSADRLAALEAEIEALENDRARINAALITTALRTQMLEEQASATERRLDTLSENEARIRASLAARRGVLAELLAALQRIGRKPPPALVTRPDDALAAVRSAILLNAVLPEMRAEAEALAADLAELVSLERQMTEERDRQRAEIGALAEERVRLERLIVEKRKGAEDTTASLDEERRKAALLAEKSGNLKDLIARLETEIDAAREAAEAARKADEAAAAAATEGSTQASVAALQDTGRFSPAIPFANAKGLLSMPARGVMLREFGADDGIGGETKGVSIATRAGARVVAPSDGWVVYAGPFRSYGQLLILNAGSGYHIVLAGMDRIDVQLGQFVLAGEPVAAMGDRKLAQAGALNILSRQPVLYVEFKKDGTSIDPSPWWASSTEEKVRG